MWVRKRRRVMERVINVVKSIGKCGLSYRGHCYEAAYDVENMSVNRSNFMELV